MANNRMAIVCKDCKIGFAIAKYYPMVKKEDYEPGMLTVGGVESEDNSGWYQSANAESMQNLLNSFFIRHKHDHDTTLEGEQQYYLGYEDDGKDWKYEEDKQKASD